MSRRTQAPSAPAYRIKVNCVAGDRQYRAGDVATFVELGAAAPAQIARLLAMGWIERNEAAPGGEMEE